MAMKETPRSLQAYFGISGGLAGLAALGQLLGTANALAKVFALVNLGFAITGIVIAARLRTMLVNSPQTILRFLVASGGWTIALSLLSLAAGINPAVLVTAVVVLLVIWYLYASVRRLSAEARAATHAAGSVGS